MKKILKFLFCLFLGTSLLTGCDESSFDFASNSFKDVYFYFVYKVGSKTIDAHVDTPVIDVINLTEEEFNNQYANEEIKNKFDYYTYQGMTYDNGEEFVLDYESIRAYLNEEWGGAGKHGYSRIDCIIYVNYTPIEYSIQYVGFESEGFNPTTYTYGNSIDLPVLENDSEYRRFKGWKIQGTDTVIQKTPGYNPTNLILEPYYEYNVYTISYSIPFTVTNPNPTTYTYYDDTINLIDFPDHPDGAYTFDGFYLDGEKITSIDPHIVKNIEIECRFTFKEFTAKYYVDDELYKTINFTYATLSSIVAPAVPKKDHYKNGKWSEQIKELKNYEIYATYVAEQYTVKIISNIDGSEKTRTFTVTYGEGTRYSALTSTLSYTEKTLVGLYLDSKYEDKVSISTLVDKSVTLYAKWVTKATIKSADDWSKIVKDPEGQYTLANDISFTMDAVPVIDNFTGILNGDGHKIQRFSNSKTDCSANYGLFKTNNGTIKNLTIEDASFVSINANGSDRVYCGLLCGTNKGTINNVDFVSTTANITANYYIEINDFSNMYGYSYVGLCCGNNQGTIRSCSISDDCQLTAKAKIGYKRNVGASTHKYIMYGYFYYGLLAGLNTGTITNITSSGSILVNGISVSESTKTWSYSYMDGTRYLTRSGGVVGRNGNGSNVGTVKDCVSNAKITVDYPDSAEAKTDFSSENRIGGIVGNNEATVENCYASSSATLTCNRKNDLEMGGIVGRQESTGKVRGCYSECAFSVISSSGSIRIGGVIGCNCGSLSYSYAIVNDATVSGSVNRSGGIGALVGYTNDTSTVMFCFGLIEITNEISIVKCYDIGSTTTNAVLNKITIYTPDQTNTINQNDKSTKANSLEDLIQAAKTYYFDEAGFTLYDNKLPTL